MTITIVAYGREVTAEVTVEKTPNGYWVKIPKFCRWIQQEKPTRQSLKRDLFHYVVPNMNARYIR